MLLLISLGCSDAPAAFPPDVVTDSPPVISRVSPTSGPVGTQVTIYGFGFSFTAPLNIISVGGAATPATDYQLLDNPAADEIEALTASIPDDSAIGQSPITVTVYDYTSNSDVLFEVTP